MRLEVSGGGGTENISGSGGDRKRGEVSESGGGIGQSFFLCACALGGMGFLRGLGNANQTYLKVGWGTEVIQS